MATQCPSAEDFLTQFHDSRPGLTPKAYASLPVSLQGNVYRSSYDLLASAVPRDQEAASTLDLACGDGFLLSLLSSRADPGLSLFGLDMSTGELAAAARRVGASASLVVGRAQELPYRAKQFDVVLCHMALMLMHDADGVLSEVHRTLKGGGTFAAIIGAKPPASPVLSSYIKALSRHSRDPQWSTVRFGDPRLRTKDGVVSLLSTRFGRVVVEDLHLPLRLSPQELWAWLLDMYDLYLLRERDREAVRKDLLEVVSSACSLDGKVEFAQSMRYLSATAT